MNKILLSCLSEEERGKEGAEEGKERRGREGEDYI
jgi:hypothetical protein